MSHNKEIYSPRFGHYGSIENPQFAWLAGIVFGCFVLFGVLGLGFGSIVAFAPFAISLPASAYVIYKTLTHEAWGMDSDELRLYNRYQALPSDVRAKVALTGAEIKRIGRDTEQFNKLLGRVNELDSVHRARMREEARLDPATKSIFDGLSQAIKDENRYRSEIKRVLGDPVEKPKVPKVESHEDYLRNRLAKKIKDWR